MRKVKIDAVLFDQSKGAAVVTLAEEDGERILPIFIGIPEGMTIFRELNRTASPRPLLHDLIQTILQGLHTRLEKVIVDAMSDTTFYARLYLRQHEALVVADARPSDAVALAIKFQAPIYVSEEVLEAAGRRADHAVPEETASRPPRPRREETSEEDIHSWLENLRPEDFADPQ
ncbi:bifunctional nuclease family protein [Candidatus Entotheonella palauensis]|uniref:bifunctional nuclease family protein n=1 Tax=Candidatus Entotheonella palauensis TaxID=93172 RepID=UPI0015C4E406|nr:bifunctional nuclease family protein [Candidatus Entotheonella palauensis]